MQFEWDESKRVSNLKKHHLDFIDADLLFDGLTYQAKAKTVLDEDRWLAVGMIHDACVTVIFTRRGDAIRLISLRRARDAEREHYQKLLE